MRYGYLQLPALIVFADISPHDHSVQEALSNLFIGEDVGEQARRILEGDDFRSRDLYLRLSVLHHERRHFHDVLLTRFGNRLFRESFAYGLGAGFILSYLASQAGQTPGPLVVDVPLVNSDVVPAYMLERLHSLRRKYTQRLASGLVTMETSATLAQGVAAAVDFGRAGVIAHLRHLAACTELGDDVGRASLVFNRLLFDHGIGLAQMTSIAWQGIIVVLSADEPDKTLPAFLLSLQRAARRLSDSTLVEGMSIALQASRDHMPAAFSELDADNSAFVKTIEASEGLRGLGETFRELSIHVARDFAAHAQELRQQYLDDADLLVGLKSYLGASSDRVEPFIYQYTSDDVSGYTRDTSWQRQLNDPLLFVQEVQRGDETIWQKACTPLAVYEGSKHLSPQWKEFALTIAGAVALCEGIDIHDRFGQMWKERIGEGFNLRFRTSLSTVPAPTRLDRITIGTPKEDHAC